MAATLRVGSVGVEIVVPLTDVGGNPLDLSTATTMSLYVQEPNSITATAKAATKLGSGKDGKLLYVTMPGDFPVPGDWKVQSRVQYTNPLRDWWSEIYPLVVAANLGGGGGATF
jgi:hypothetical protein